jgi:hypothetical protein
LVVRKTPHPNTGFNHSVNRLALPVTLYHGKANSNQDI